MQSRAESPSFSGAAAAGHASRRRGHTLKVVGAIREGVLILVLLRGRIIAARAAAAPAAPPTLVAILFLIVAELMSGLRVFPHRVEHVVAQELLVVIELLTRHVPPERHRVVHRATARVLLARQLLA